MQKQRRINIDFNNSRSRFSQRTNEATLVVGKRGSEDISASSNKNNGSSNITEDSNDNKKNQKSLLLKFVKKQENFKNLNKNSLKDKDSHILIDSTDKETEKNDDLPKSPTNNKPVTLTVKFHEMRTSSDTVLVNPALVPGAKVGDIGEIQCLSGSKKKFFFVFKEFKKDSGNSKTNMNSIGADKLLLTNTNNENDINSFSGSIATNTMVSNNASNSNTTNLDSKLERQTDSENHANFNGENFNTSSNSVISILSGMVVNTLDLKPRSQVLVRVRNKDSVQADTVEIYVKDIHLSRGDMWNISSLLVDKCIHKNEKLSFINGSIRLNIQKIYKNGHKFFSSYVGKDTKIVFRSDSARLIVFIQISAEMWHFEESGQQMFHKLVNSFFPKAFQKWKDLDTHHLITIIFFSSVDMDGEKIRYSEGETPPNKTDYYRVVVDQVHILLWNEIMATLRLEFANFKRDIYLHKNKHIDEQHPQEYLIEGSILPSAKGSVLEAVNLGMSLVCDDFKDPSLRQTTNHFIFISPGSGLFDVSYDMLIRTSKLMTTVDSTIDIICLSQPPLHIVPLVRYLDNQNRLQHCIPNWLDISFWSDSSQAVHQWLPKSKIYELQMMGVMENELSSVNINELDLSNHRSAIDAMEAYDRDVFNTVLTKREKKSTNKSKHLPVQKKSNTSNVSSIRHHRFLDDHGPSGLKPKELIVSNNKSSPATCNAFGVTTTSKPNVSAFSSLLSLSKNTDVQSSSSLAYNFVRKMISTPMLKPLSPNSDIHSTHSLESDLKNIDSLTLSDASKITDEPGRAMSIPLGGRNSTSSTISLDSMNNHNHNHNHRLSNPQLLNGPQTLSRKQRARRTTVQNKAVSKTSTRSVYLEQRDSISNSYWTKINNPSNTLTTELLSMVSYGRWRFVFPPNIRRRSVKWTSLSSPASLPLMTTIFPTLADFNQNYTFRIYDVLLNQDTTNETQTSETLMKSMISLRLSLGFQICIGEKVEKVEKNRKPNGDNKMLVQFLNKDNFIGSRVYLSLGNEIHRICCDFNGLLNVQVYRRLSSTDEQLTLSTDRQYIENIRTRYSEKYSPVTITNSNNQNKKNYNWNQLDQVLAGYNESIDKQKYHRMKFVILPANVPENAFSLTNEKLTTEEIRLEGIRSMIMNIYKIRFRTNEEKKFNKRLEISPEMYFYTGNLFEYLKHESNSMLKSRKHKSLIPESMLSPTVSHSGSIKDQQYNKSIDPYKLVSILQSDEGIPIIDRHWHLKFYRYCFLGMDLVNFLVENFEDIETREDAVEYGNKLMSEKIFSHAVARHNFLDGHYFYYLNKKFTDASAKIPTTQESESERKDENKEFIDKNDKNSTIDDDKKDRNDETGKITNETIMLSKEVLSDLDPNGYSWQPELIKVHYDIVHNPDHCFHLRLEWLSTTSKLIEDLINGWSKHCERYGLSLVEVPWEELFTLPIRNPLHSTIEISLALNPWEDDEFKVFEKIYKKEKYYFHLYLLEKGSFMLDNRTATYFKDDAFDVVYSWGKPMFKYAQFIHFTGGYIAELRNNGDFFLAPNNAHISRLNLNIGKLHNLGKSKAIYFDSQSVMLEFRSICTNEKKLREVFREAVQEYEKNENFI